MEYPWVQSRMQGALRCMSKKIMRQIPTSRAAAIADDICSDPFSNIEEIHITCL